MARTTRRAGAKAPAPTTEQEPIVADNETLDEENARLAGDTESPAEETLDEENARLAEKPLDVADGPKPQVSPGGEAQVNKAAQAPPSQKEVASQFSPSAVYGGVPIVVSAEDYRTQLGVQAMEEAKVLGMDITVPGGKYMVGGTWVDANGKPL